MRIGAECGGTFTDVIITSSEGKVAGYTKVFSTPSEPSVAVLEGVSHIFSDLEEPTTTSMIHGSTVATNSLIERKGGTVGLITTHGFEDVLHIQRQDRSKMYDLSWASPEPLVPRKMIRGVRERISSRGEISLAIDEEEVDRAITSLVESGASAIAVSLIHSYANSIHEEFIKSRIESLHPALDSSISSVVSREFREFERTNTTTVDAFLKPRIRSYLESLESRASDFGIRSLQVMQSNGGVVPSAVAAALPVSMLRSGPAAGVAAATSIARELGTSKVVTLDMGGTSTDVSVVDDYTPLMASELKGFGLPVKVPLVDIVAVGAGGGSKVYFESDELLSVGPESVGSEPGPICYGKGGTQLTVSDINLVKGILHEKAFLGGRVSLASENVRAEVARIANERSLSQHEFIENCFRLANANMANAIRIATTERGVDPADFTLVAYGGAGPLHAAKVAEEMGIRTVIVPALAGIASALGLLVADFRREFAQTWLAENTAPDRTIEEVCDQLKARAKKALQGLGVDPTGMNFGFTADMRYKGQGFELNVEVPHSRATLQEMGERFNKLHADRYGHADQNRPVQLVTLRLIATAESEVEAADYSELEEPGFSLDFVSDIIEGNQEVQARFLTRDNMPLDRAIEGPLVVLDPTSTTYTPSGWSARIDENMILTLAKED